MIQHINNFTSMYLLVFLLSYLPLLAETSIGSVHGGIKAILSESIGRSIPSLVETLTTIHAAAESHYKMCTNEIIQYMHHPNDEIMEFKENKMLYGVLAMRPHRDMYNTFIISVSSYYLVNATFRHFNLPYVSRCSHSYVQLNGTLGVKHYNMKTREQNERYLPKYCGLQLPWNVYGNEISVVFKYKYQFELFHKFIPRFPGAKR